MDDPRVIGGAPVNATDGVGVHIRRHFPPILVPVAHYDF